MTGPAIRPAPAGSVPAGSVLAETGRLGPRIDAYPTRRIGGLGVRRGRPMPLGATAVPGGVNFAVYSDAATAVTLVLFRRGEREPRAELPIPPEFRIGSVHAIQLCAPEQAGLDYDDLEYGFRADGPWDPAAGHRFDRTAILADPYARLVSGREVWGVEPDWTDPYPFRSRLLFDDFDWGDDRPPRHPPGELVIYELHVRGFTRHPSSGVTAPGTYAGLAEKVPYLAELGVSAVELMPVFEFDEFENSHVLPETGERLYNYWGYGTHSFFAPKAGYALSGRYGMQADEMKTLIRTLHRAGIEVILDVVLNHTAEGGESGRTISFRGLDNATWYMLTPEGQYYNFSGTGNTMNCNHPVVRNFVIDCLRYWVAEFHVDGFRFDLAAILSRDENGAPLPNPPLLQSIAYDPVLRHCRLIAEAWDAGGLYQVGKFPDYGRWSEWNGRYRDTVRRFVKGDAGMAGLMADALSGSHDLYAARGPLASVNFVTCHDGFTLADLVSYDGKHNEANGEANRDGADDNNSWNCGAEGPTDDPAVLALRGQQARNVLALLLTSTGVPMLLAGDEFGRTQQGNNNAYCHDTELAWVDWTLADAHPDLVRFTRTLLAQRRAHAAVRPRTHPTGDDDGPAVAPHVSWHGLRPGEPDWSDDSRLVVAVRTVGTDAVLVAANAGWQPLAPQLPAPPDGLVWHRAVDTAAAAPADCYEPGTEPTVPAGPFPLPARCVAVLVAAHPAARPAGDPSEQEKA
jgi:isoamylase